MHHLIAAVCSLYTISLDWSGSLCCSLTLAWDYDNRTVDVYMPGYIEEALHKFQNPKRKRRQHSTHAWTHTVYGATFQYTDNIDNTPPLLTKAVRLVQKIVGTLLYYKIAIYFTMFFAFGSIDVTQS